MTVIIRLLGIILFCSAPVVLAQAQFLRSVDGLADPRGYCLDIPGFGDNIQLDGPLGAHSCKYGIPGFWVDELFVHTDEGHLQLPEYGLCLAAPDVRHGAPVTLTPCSNGSPLAWTMRDNQTITPVQDGSLCITFSAERTFVNSNENTLPAYSSRTITLENCAADIAHRQRLRWANPMEMQTWDANTLRDGMDPGIASQIAALGNTVNPPGTRAIYAGVTREFTLADIDRTGPIAYGPHARHRLQVYTGKYRNHPRRSAPVLVLVHGGGFTAGSLESLQDAAMHFAGLGYVVVNITYPLAPESQYPAGAEAVARAIQWAANNVQDYQGSPDRIYVLGHSAGANHVANALYRPSLHGIDNNVAGVILASPGLMLDAENTYNPDHAYLGNLTQADWPDATLFGHIERPDIPLLILLAEFDPMTFKRSGAQLFSNLINDHGADPRLRQLPGHGHISYMIAIGTDDRLATEEIIDFMATAGQ